MGAILKWLATAIRDWLNGYINPNWKADQEQLQRDAAEHQRQAKVVEAENVVIEERVVAREAEAEQLETKRVVENERIEKSTDLKDLWFPKK